MALFTALAIAAGAAASAYAAKKQSDAAKKQVRQAERAAAAQEAAAKKAQNLDINQNALGTALGDTNAAIELGSSDTADTRTTNSAKKQTQRSMLGVGGVSASKIGGL